MSFQDYLKKFTSINNKFIDDFFSLYDSKTTDNDFVIDLDNVIKWLKTQKKHIKKTLMETYTLDLDYKIKLRPSTGGRPSEQVSLTPSCFKRLCMLSRTKKAEDVRNYFIEIENHLDKYKSHIISALSEKVNKYEKELKPTPEIKTGGVIYILKTNQNIEGVYKIGMTREFKDRLKTHQSSQPDKIDIAHIYETDNVEAVEGCLKGLLKQYAHRKRKEFYEVDINLIKSLIRQCDCMSLSMRKRPKDIKDEECKFIIHILKNSKSDQVLYDDGKN